MSIAQQGEARPGNGTFGMELKEEVEEALPCSRQAAMLWLMRSYFRNPVCLPLLKKNYRCKHETFHQLQACRIAQAGGS